MSNWTFCVVTYLHGYQRVEGYEGEGNAQRVVLACGHKPGLNELTYGIDEVVDAPAEPAPEPVTVISVPVEAAIAAAEVAGPEAEWQEVVAAAPPESVTVLTEISSDD